MAKGNGELKLLEALKDIGAKIDGLRTDMNGGFARVLKAAGEHGRDHEERPRAVEAKLGLK